MDVDFNNIDDIFTAEEQISKKSFEEGYQHGIEQGKIEGHSMGREHGKRAAKEFGDQFGFSLVMLEVLKGKGKPLRQGEQQAMRRMNEVVRSSEEVGKYDKECGDLTKFHEVLQKNRRRCHEAKKFLKVKGCGSPREERSGCGSREDRLSF